MNKTKRMRKIEAELGKPIDELILEGLNDGKSQAELAKEFGINPATLCLWLIRLGLEVKRTIIRR